MPYWFGGFFNPGGGIFFSPKKQGMKKEKYALPVCITLFLSSLSSFLAKFYGPVIKKKKRDGCSFWAKKNMPHMWGFYVTSFSDLTFTEK